jgi:hypothetical protein
MVDPKIESLVLSLIDKTDASEMLYGQLTMVRALNLMEDSIGLSVPGFTMLTHFISLLKVGFVHDLVGMSAYESQCFMCLLGELERMRSRLQELHEERCKHPQSTKCNDLAFAEGRASDFRERRERQSFALEPTFEKGGAEDKIETRLIVAANKGEDVW